MKKGRQFKNFKENLDQDLYLKRAISKARRQTHRKTANKAADKAGNLADFFFVSLAIASRFVSKKTARTLEEILVLVYLLVQAIILLKENVFDRPDVQEFLSRQSKHILATARTYVDQVLSLGRESLP